jgi:hypothetical protein
MIPSAIVGLVTVKGLFIWNNDRGNAERRIVLDANNARLDVYELLEDPIIVSVNVDREDADLWKGSLDEREIFQRQEALDRLYPVGEQCSGVGNLPLAAIDQKPVPFRPLGKVRAVKLNWVESDFDKRPRRFGGKAVNDARFVGLAGGA